MQEFDTVKTAVSIITKHHPDNLVLLHCVSAYPTPLQDVNLSLINLYKDTFSSVPIGYSGHELGIAVSIGAVALGAKVIKLVMLNHKRLLNLLKNYYLDDR